MIATDKRALRYEREDKRRGGSIDTAGSIYRSRDPPAEVEVPLIPWLSFWPTL